MNRRHLLLAAAAALPGRGWGCGFDGEPPGTAFMALHPGSLDVALGTRDLIERGRVAALAPVPPEQGHERAHHVLDDIDQRVRKVIGAAGAPTAPSLALLLVEAGLWTRWTPTSGGAPAMRAHAEGPLENDAVLVTSEAVLRSVLAGDVAWAEAEEAGALRVDQARPAVWTAVLGPETRDA